MDALDKYITAKREVEEARAYLAKLAAGAKVVDVVFYCGLRSKDDTNSLVMPKSMREEASAATKGRVDNILAQALTAMETELSTLAKAAKAEYAQIAADAGLPLP